MLKLQRRLLFIPLLLLAMGTLAACGPDESPATLPETGGTSMPGGMMDGTVTPGEMMSATVTPGDPGGGMMDATVAPGGMMTGTVSPGDTAGGMIDGTATPGEMGATDWDQAFLYMMVPHHEGAIEMARIAQERAEHAEIKDMAGDIIAAQESEIEQMREWLQQWYGGSETPSMGEMPMVPGIGSEAEIMDMAQEVEDLRNADEPFDLAFIDAMIEHHQSAIDAAELGLEQATRPEIKDLAQAIIDAQQREIEQLLAWREAWYPHAPTGLPLH